MLTVKQIEAEIRKGEAKRLQVDEGLILKIAATGAANWQVRYTLHGKRAEMGLGPYRDVTLAQARLKRDEARLKVASGIDPRATTTTTTAAVTFDEAARQYIEAKAPGWKNAKHHDQWRNTLSTYVSPTIGTLPVQDVTTEHCETILRPIWAKKAETARRVRNRIELVLDFATAKKWRTGDNPARWTGLLEHLLDDKPLIRRHHPALSYAEAPAFVATLRARLDISSRALEFLILSGCRTSEVIGAKWSEFDIDKALWIVPAERMKTKRTHTVPMSDRMLEILLEVPKVKGVEFVFIGRRNRQLSNMAMLELMRGMELNEVPHGFRSTFRDWAAETTQYEPFVVEKALAHAIGDKVEAAYRRGDLLAKRRELMQEWANYLNFEKH